MQLQPINRDLKQNAYKQCMIKDTGEVVTLFFIYGQNGEDTENQKGLGRIEKADGKTEVIELEKLEL
jgi:hypothetical protein